MHATHATHDAATPDEAPRDTGGPSGESAGEPDRPPADAAAPEDGREAAPAESEGPRPLGVAVRPTGHQEIDAALARLADADHLAVSAHVEVYEDVHRGLRSTLTALDQHEPGS
ncbi:hypothetical protein [Streptomyces durbertensis]|uniref:hypothetical protein n=1 Tax=Streptomyces durbertensis TaxID=2448886 RepID=UPI003F697751